MEANFGTIPSKGFDDRGIREPRRARVANHRGTKCRFTAIVTAFVSQFKAFVLDSNGIYIPPGLKIERDYGISRSKYTRRRLKKRREEREREKRMEGSVGGDGKGSEARFFYPEKPLNENSIGRGKTILEK